MEKGKNREKEKRKQDGQVKLSNKNRKTVVVVWAVFFRS